MGFEMTDTNKNGYIGKKEFFAAMNGTAGREEKKDHGPPETMTYCDDAGKC